MYVPCSGGIVRGQHRKHFVRNAMTKAGQVMHLIEAALQPVSTSMERKQ